MTDIRKKFTNADTDAAYDYSGTWDVNGKEKRIVFPLVYDGLFCDITPAVAEKLIGVQYPGLKAKKPGKQKEETAADKK